MDETLVGLTEEELNKERKKREQQLSYYKMSIEIGVDGKPMNEELYELYHKYINLEISFQEFTDKSFALLRAGIDTTGYKLQMTSLDMPMSKK